MKKTIAAVLAAVSISLAAGCAANLPAGYDKFTAAREKYETLSSGRVTMTDLTTGDEIMRFSFYFNVNDEMVFSYWGSWQGEEQQAYSDGAEFFYKESGDEKWTVISSDDDGYIYNVYNRGYRYPYAEGRAVPVGLLHRKKTAFCVIRKEPSSVGKDIDCFRSFLCTFIYVEGTGYGTGRYRTANRGYCI